MAEPKPVGEILEGAFGPPGDDDAQPEKKAKRTKPPLGKFEGKDVLAARLAIRGAGDGLSDALDIVPVAYHHGDTLFVLLEVTVDKVRFDSLKDVDAAARVHDCKTVVGTIVDPEVAEHMLEEQKRAIALAKEEAEGVQRIPGTEDT